MAAIDHDRERAQRALAALSAERADHARARQAAEARAAAAAQAQAAQHRAVEATDRYRAAMTAIQERIAPLAGLIAEALQAEDAVWRVEQARPGTPLLRHTRQRIVDALRVVGFEAGLTRTGEFVGHPSRMSFGQVPLSAAFSALPAGLADPAQAPPPQALSAHAPRAVEVEMPPLSPDPAFSGSPFDPQPQPAQALPPLLPFDPTRR